MLQNLSLRKRHNDLDMKKIKKQFMLALLRETLTVSR